MGFLGGFSDRFMIALGVWPFASVILTLPILAILYNRDGRLKFWSVTGAYLSVLYGLGLIFFTLWPLPSGDSGLGITYGVEPQFNPFAFIEDIRKDGLQAVFQILANIAFFIPLGFIFGRGLRIGLPLSVTLSFAVSLLIETAQLTGLFGIYPYSYRTFDVSDLVWNTAGASAGWFAAKAMSRIVPPDNEDLRSVTTSPSFLQRSVALLIDMSIVGISTLGVSLMFSFLSYLLDIDKIVGFGLGGILGFIVLVISFIIIEFVVPWFNAGQTPGGAFVRMTIENHDRPDSRRILFYAMRFVVMLACVIIWPLPIAMFAIPAMLLYYMVKHQMPYDAI